MTIVKVNMKSKQEKLLLFSPAIFFQRPANKNQALERKILSSKKVYSYSDRLAFVFENGGRTCAVE